MHDIYHKATIKYIHERIIEAERRLFCGIGVIAFEFAEDVDDDSQQTVEEDDDEGGDYGLEHYELLACVLRLLA